MRSSAVSGRREPPAFRIMSVINTHRLTPHMIRVTFGGADLKDLAIEEPAASVRILLPSPGTSELEMPMWNGNEFLLADDTRPVIRTFTPRHFDEKTRELDIDMVLHDGGIASQWAIAAQPGAPAALSGPGRGYTIDEGSSDFLFAGDEAAIPAISQLLEVLPVESKVQVEIEVRNDDARLDLPDHPGATIGWHVKNPNDRPGEALVGVVAASHISTETVVWCAGEAASMHRIRTYLFKEVGIERSQATVRGYWKIDRRT